MRQGSIGSGCHCGPTSRKKKKTAFGFEASKDRLSLLLVGNTDGDFK
jgi:hypothetical protein